MVKQFTIPCDFQGQMAPVTLYIGHPEATHHPINFQSQWLSSARGGQVPQDLMDTLQKLHDLALENNADFEELCYYALISATNNSSGNGVNPDDINKYADDFVKKEASGVKPNMPTDNNTEQQEGAQTTPNVSAKQNENVDANGNVITKSKQQEEQNDATATSSTNTQSPANTQEPQTAKDNTDNSTQATSQTTEETATEQTTEQEPQKVMPTINATPTTQTTPNENNNTDNTTNSNELMEEPVSNISQQTKDIVNDAISSTYSQDDEDLLLMDDMEPIDNIINATTQSNPQTQQDNNIKEAEQINDNNDNNNNGSVYDDEDADLLG